MRITKDKTISPQQMKALQTTFRRIGMDDDARHDCIYAFTDGRTQSSKELSFDEARRLLASLNEDQAEKACKEAKELVKAIFGLSFQISFLNKGYTNDTQEVSKMYLSELRAFKKQLEAVAHKEKNQLKTKKS